MHLLEIEAPTWQQSVLMALGSLVALLVRWIGKKLEWKEAKTEAITNLGVGVLATGGMFFDPIKKAGQSTEEAQAEARRRAIDYAISISGSLAQQIIRAWTPEQARIHVEAAVAAKNAGQ